MALIDITQNNHIATLTLNRPEALNALNTQLLEALSAELDKLMGEPDLRCLIITGAGPKSFVAGADIAEMAGMDPVQGEAFGKFGNAVFSKLAAFPCPVIAAINGFALGGGFEIALACDLRIASENARFAFPETGLGITPGFGGTQRLARLVGPALASELIFTGRHVKSEEARVRGIVSEVLPQDQLLARAEEIAQSIASKAPIAVRKAKEAIRGGLDLDLAGGLNFEAGCFGACFGSEDQKNAMQAFLKKETFTDFQNR